MKIKNKHKTLPQFLPDPHFPPSHPLRPWSERSSCSTQTMTTPTTVHNTPAANYCRPLASPDCPESFWTDCRTHSDGHTWSPTPCTPKSPWSSCPAPADRTAAPPWTPPRPPSRTCRKSPTTWLYSRASSGWRASSSATAPACWPHWPVCAGQWLVSTTSARICPPRGGRARSAPEECRNTGVRGMERCWEPRMLPRSLWSSRGRMASLFSRLRRLAMVSWARLTFWSLAEWMELRLSSRITRPWPISWGKGALLSSEKTQRTAWLERRTWQSLADLLARLSSTFSAPVVHYPNRNPKWPGKGKRII